MVKKKTKSTRAPSKWLVHVKSTMKANPKMKFKDVLKEAKKTYKK